MAAALTGKKPGDSCPGCKEGRLLVRTREHGSGGGIGGTFYSRTSIAHLVCGSCSGMYEALDRGKDPRTLLEAQLKGFENPKEIPTACPKCEGTLVERLDGEEDFAIRTRFRSCEACLAVAWVFPEETRTEISEFPQFAGRRMPSPPTILQDPPRRRR